MNFTKIFFISIILLTFFSAIYLNPYNPLPSTSPPEFSNSTFHYNSNSIFSWPLFGYYSISSAFGYRLSPTTGASTYHSGIDIPANERN